MSDPNYFALIQKFPLRRLKDDADLDAAIAVMDHLVDKGDLDAGEEEYRGVLADLIHSYEAEHDPLPDLDPVDALQSLVSENELTQVQPGSNEAVEQAEELLDDWNDSYQRGKFDEAKTRNEFAMIAANITDDRYSAGSTAARVVLAILLTHGLQAAKEFVEDLEHHEH